MSRRKIAVDILAPVRRLLKRLSERDVMIVLSLFVGIACGFAAVLLTEAIHFFQHAISSVNSSGEHTYIYILFPGLGMLIAMLFVRYIVKDNIGHGVTKVLLAVSKNESKIRPHNMWTSMAASSVTIGFGGSVGAEAPIVYTGAAIGSNVARYMGLSYKNMTILLGCGAAGAVAGIFKAPLAGVLFTLEILLFNISMSSILPLLLSTISATVVACLCSETGSAPPFECTISPFAMGNIPYYILLGLFCSACSVYFTRMTLWLEDKIKSIEKPYVRWALSAISLGLLIFLLPPLFGEGYTCIRGLLNDGSVNMEGKTVLSFMFDTAWMVPIFFLLVLILKVFSMSFTNAGGGVGGTFGPTLFMGAIAGFVVSRTINLIGGDMTVPEQNFVLVGMAGLMAGVMQAPMTAIFLIADMTGGYELLIPLIMTATISYAVTRAVEPYSIYTKRIAKKGELLTHDSDQAVLTLLKTGDLIEKDFLTVKIDATLGELVEVVSRSTRNIFPVIDSRGHFQGFVSLEDIRRDMFKTEQYKTLHVYNFMRSAPAYVYVDEKMDSVMKKFEQTEAWNLPVIEQDRTYVGFVSKSKIFSAYREQLKQVSHD